MKGNSGLKLENFIELLLISGREEIEVKSAQPAHLKIAKNFNRALYIRSDIKQLVRRRSNLNNMRLNDKHQACEKLFVLRVYHINKELFSIERNEQTRYQLSHSGLAGNQNLRYETRNCHSSLSARENFSFQCNQHPASRQIKISQAEWNTSKSRLFTQLNESLNSNLDSCFFLHESFSHLIKFNRGSFSHLLRQICSTHGK